MPDVGRSDSQRSDSSLRPRVSFNRDVHIKRIGRSEGGVVAALTSDGEGHLVATPVRRERGQRSRSELAKEAALVLKHADQVQSITAVPPGVIPNSYNSLDRTKLRKRKTPVQQIFSDEGNNNRNIDNFRTGRRLTRSVSDVGKGSLRHRDKLEEQSPDKKNDEKKLSIFATLDRRLRKTKKEHDKSEQKQLSPILEDESNKGNPFTFAPKIVIEPATPVDEKYKYGNEYSIENNMYGNNKDYSKKQHKGNIKRRGSLKNGEDTEGSGQENQSVISSQDLYDNSRRDKKRNKDSNRKTISPNRLSPNGRTGKHDDYDHSINETYSNNSVHDTQDKRKNVKRIIRELSQRDTKRISPPKSTVNALVDPTVDADRQHNKNRPFSYIHPNTSPTSDADQVIYAQVVCSGGDKPNEEITKRTIHTTVDRRINTDIEEEDEGDRELINETNMKTTNDNSILDHLSLRRDRLESRIDSHKRRFQQNILTNHNYNVNSNYDNRYSTPTNEIIPTTDNSLGSITDLTTKERYFEHHIKTTASSYRHKDFLSDSPSPSVLDQKHKERHNDSIYDYKPQQNRKEEHNKHYDEHRDDYSQKQTKDVKTSDKKHKDTTQKKTTKLDKVRQLVSWNRKSKSNSTADQDPVKARYVEYRGGGEDTENHTIKDAEYYANRRRVATPVKNDSTWFKSLTRRSKHKDRKLTTPVPEDGYQTDRQYSSKTLRFFGDSDRDSIQSTNTLQPVRNSRVRPPPDSSAESTLEDESGQSQKSVVYLHAAAVGDIPGSKKLHRSQLSNGRRALSREELSMSNGSSSFVPHSRTLSRSISVLAPWRPRHPRDGIEVNYNNVGKPPKAPVKTTTKTPSKPEKKKQKEATLGRRGSDESKKSGSNISQESLSSSKRHNQSSYGIDTVDSSNTNSLNRRLKKTNSETNLTNSSNHLHSKTSGWFRGRE